MNIANSKKQIELHYEMKRKSYVFFSFEKNTLNF